LTTIGNFLADLAAVIERSGYRALPVASVKAGREILNREFVDLLLLDERIKIDSGIRFLEEQRGTPFRVSTV